MQRKTRWIMGTAVAVALLLGAALTAGVSAQSAPPAGAPGAGYCPGFGIMGGFGPRQGVGAGIGSYGAAHDAVASTLGITSQELFDARASGKSVAELAQEKNVPLQTVVDAVAAADSQQLDAAVKAGTLTQAQADALTQLTRSPIETQLQTPAGFFPGMGPGMMGGRGIMGGGFGFGPCGRGAP